MRSASRRRTISYRRFATLALIALLTRPATGAAQERDLAITVYNNDLGLVREVRPVELAKGRAVVTLPRVAAQIDPTSVRVRSLTAPDRVSILEQRYTYDLVNSDTLLRKYIDREVDLEVEGTAAPVRGRLLSLDGAVTLLREDGRIDIIRREAVRRIGVTALPAGLVTEPTLTWLVDNTGSAGAHRMEVGYLTRGLSWHVEYTAVVNPQKTNILLSGWASIDNHSGMTYENAALTLVAGDVNRIEDARPGVRFKTASSAMERAEMAPQFDQEQVFEYHTYNLDRRATIENNASVQLAMLSDTGVRTTQHYVYDGAFSPTGVQTRLRLENRESHGLGRPLPRGKIRMYQETENGARQFIGEDAVKDLAKDETVYLTVGRAFDIVGERTQTDVRQLSNRSREESFRVALRNHQAEGVTVKVVEHLTGAPNWFIRQSSLSYQKTDARTIEFDAPVPKDGEAVVEYTVVYRW